MSPQTPTGSCMSWRPRSARTRLARSSAAAGLPLGTLVERVRALSGKAASLDQAAAEERAIRVRAEQIARRRERASAIAADVAADAGRVLHVLASSLGAYAVGAFLRGGL